MASSTSRLFLFFLIGLMGGAQGKEDELTVLVGEDATLSSPADPSCGPLHSVKWYRDGQRIALLAETANIARGDGPMADRLKLTLTSPTDLRISPVEAKDEDQYKCDLTYIMPADHCESAKVFNLRTLMKPSGLFMKDQAGNELNNDSALGGLLEGSQSAVECWATGGRPAPKLVWTVGETEMPGDTNTVGEDEEAVTTSRLLLNVGREHQGLKLKCSASSEALEEPLSIALTLDLIMRPTDIDISGVEHHVVQGSKVTFECSAKGARPPAVISWYNDTLSVPADQTLTTSELQDDDTYITTSRLSFWATRWDNERLFNCEARQLAAPIQQGEAPLNASQVLDVHFPPVVSVEPENITVNETTDILLFCNYEANPVRLLSVKWLQGTKEISVESEPDRYEGGDLKQQALLIKKSTEDDIGEYYCRLENPVGTSTSPDFVSVDVHFKPEVYLTMEPEGHVIDGAHQNVTLQCTVERGNPSTLFSVRWFLDQELLKQLPDCNSTDDDDITRIDMCADIEPTQLLLTEIDKSFHGNYSCQGRSLAGWGPRSNETELIVYYAPTRGELTYSPQQIVKGESFNLTCTVHDLGRPRALSYEWKRGMDFMTDVDTMEWYVSNATVETESNYTCTAVNEAGINISNTIYIDILAPPVFITNLTAKTSFVYNSSDISLNCRIECSPICEVIWFKNKQPLNPSGSQDLYSVVDIVASADPENNTFEAADSTLMFNMENWPDQQLDRIYDNANYTCTAKSNGIGVSVSSTTTLNIEYPPENMTVSNKVVSVKEGHYPEKVICAAKGNPEPSYHWLRDITPVNPDSTASPPVEETLSRGYALELKRGVQRADSGNLICRATNAHGSVEINTYLNVMYKPECSLTQTEVDDEKVLVCTANANPTEVTFDWYIQDDNDTIEDEVISQIGVKSTLHLDQIAGVEGVRIFVCSVNNSVGISEPCTIQVQGILPWYRWWSHTALMVAIAVAIILLLVILLCLIILCVCRRKRANSKSPVNGAANNNNGIEPPQEYENLPFHGLQQAPNKPFRPDINDQLIYADADLKDYGPINYKQASIYAQMKKIKEQQKMEFARKDD